MISSLFRFVKSIMAKSSPVFSIIAIIIEKMAETVQNLRFGNCVSATVLYYRSDIPLFLHIDTVSSSQTDDCTSPICAFSRSNIERRD